MEFKDEDFKLLTFSGIYVNFKDPKPETMRLLDIATGLSNESRYAGQSLKNYVVGQHCVLASHIVPNEFALEALFHDATEAYLKDLPTWLKLMLPGYKDIEENFEVAIRTQFGLELDTKKRTERKKIIKEYDYKLLATEKRDLMPQDGEDWYFLKNVSPLPFKIEPWGHVEAKDKFISRYNELVKGQF